MSTNFVDAGKQVSEIPVRISYRIIQLFSEGLYSSPNKALEELVSNSYDAGAKNVHVLLSSDLSSTDSLIGVVDDGEAMDEVGLRQHWLIGVSNKRELEELSGRLPHGRKQIGKFGIGKLATFVLARKFTLICRKKKKYYAVTMDYENIPEGREGSVELDGEGVNLPLRNLTLKQAKDCLPALLLYGNKPGYKAIELFGPNAPESWTVAILSDLKNMAQNIQLGRLSWVLRNAMPLSSDFRLFLNGDPQRPTKLDQKPLKRWILGKDLKALGDPAPDDLQVTRDNTEPQHRWGLTHPQLGRITGFAEVYEQRLSERIGRSHGFFVYVRGRLLNINDTHFGIPANALRHGTFVKFRMIVHINQLDNDLRSTRETVREAELIPIARNILRAVFNVARTWLRDHEEQQTPGFKATARIRQSPGSLTRRPILNLLQAAIGGKYSPRFLRYPQYLSGDKAERFFSEIETRAETDDGLVDRIETVDMSPDDVISSLDVWSGTLQINRSHPFVATYPDSFERDETLSLFSMAEVLTEAYLYALGIDEDQVFELMERRDELLRELARSRKRPADVIARDLEDAATDENRLEKELVAAFDCLGFDARHIGGKGRPDGKATAYLGARSGQEQQYSVSLEAKSKEVPGKRVQSSSVDISRIAAHRDDYGCNHTIIVGPDFATTHGENAALIKDARANIEKTDKTITFMRAHDLARLVRLRTVTNLGLDRLRKLFQECVTPAEAKQWVDNLEQEEQPKPLPYIEILETIWELQQKMPHQAVAFSTVTTLLLMHKNISLTTSELKSLCKALELLVPGGVAVRQQNIELTQRPDLIIEAAGKTMQRFPEEEQRLSLFKL